MPAPERCGFCHYYASRLPTEGDCCVDPPKMLVTPQGLGNVNIPVLATRIGCKNWREAGEERPVVASEIPPSGKIALN